MIEVSGFEVQGLGFTSWMYVRMMAVRGVVDCSHVDMLGLWYIRTWHVYDSQGHNLALAST